MSKMVKELAKRLGRDPSKFASKSMRRSAATQLAEVGMPTTGSQMVGNWKGVTTPMEHVEHVSKACNDRMSILDREELGSPPKKLKASGNCGNANEAGGIVQNNCTVINIIGSIVGSVGEALKVAGIVKVDEQGLKDE